MWQRTLRRWIWRASAVLAACVLAISVRAVTYEAAHIDVSSRVPPLVLPDAWEIEPPVSRDELDAHVAVVRRFHGKDRDAAELAAMQPIATEPPLAAYRVLLYVRDPDGAHGVTLVCKDPAHPRTYRLWVGDSHNDASLESAHFAPKTAVFDVIRGEERFAFRVPLRLGGTSRAIRAVPRAGEVGGARARPQPSTTPRPPLPVRDAKFVAFSDSAGEAAGVRITGVKPGSWLDELGVEPGDVIQAWEDEAVRRPADLQRSAEAEALPRTIQVVRNVASASPQELQLRRS